MSYTLERTTSEPPLRSVSVHLDKLICDGCYVKYATCTGVPPTTHVGTPKKPFGSAEILGTQESSWNELHLFRHICWVHSN
jgi:hypothetical protein